MIVLHVWCVDCEPHDDCMDVMIGPFADASVADEFAALISPFATDVGEMDGAPSDLVSPGNSPWAVDWAYAHAPTPRRDDRFEVTRDPHGIRTTMRFKPEKES